MTRGARHGVTLEGRNAELEQRRALMGAEIEHLEAEIDRTFEALRVTRAALRRIANAESGVWGWIAHEALEASTVDVETEAEAEA